MAISGLHIALGASGLVAAQGRAILQLAWLASAAARWPGERDIFTPG